MVKSPTYYNQESKDEKQSILLIFKAYAKQIIPVANSSYARPINVSANDKLLAHLEHCN